MGKSKHKANGNDVPVSKKKKGKERLMEVVGTKMEDLHTSLGRYNDSFSHLLGLIPARFYLHNEDGEDGEREPTIVKKPNKTRRRQLELEQKQLEQDMARAKRKAKKAKFDPNTPRTVLEIQSARAQVKVATDEQRNNIGDDAEENFEDNIAVNGFGQIMDGETREDPSIESGLDDGIEVVMPRMYESASKPGNAQYRFANALPTSLFAPGQTAATGEASREALLLERRQHRGEMRDKRRNELKERKRKEKESGITRKNGREDSGQLSSIPSFNTSNKADAMSDLKKALKKAGKRSSQYDKIHPDEDAVMLPVSMTSSSKNEASIPSTVGPELHSIMSATSANAAGPSSSGIAFSSLDFTPSNAVQASDISKSSKKARLAMSASTRTGVTSHDPIIALNALNKRSEFLDKLTPQARERAEEKDKWERMGMKAEGTKVYDEEARLKKMVKRKEKAKDKSRKDWADRKETVANSQAAAAKKRTDNIDARLQLRRDKKLGVKPSKSVGKPNAKKKGRPGFEGRGGGRGSSKR